MWHMCKTINNIIYVTQWESSLSVLSCYEDVVAQMYSWLLFTIYACNLFLIYFSNIVNGKR